MERCTIVVHCLQLFSFIRKDFYAKLTGTTVTTPRGGGIILKKGTVMSGGSIPAIKVDLRTIRRVNPTMRGFRSALSVKLYAFPRNIDIVVKRRQRSLFQQHMLGNARSLLAFALSPRWDTLRMIMIFGAQRDLGMTQKSITQSSD